MTPVNKEQTDWQPAPLKKARCLLGIAVVASSLIVIAMTTHLVWPGFRHHAHAGHWMKILTLSAPALWPAGSPMRHPETMHPSIDLRFSPGVEHVP